jgi:kynurenine 3-monooxygenase
MPTKNILIIGAGLSGSLLSIFLAQQGYNIQVVESRPDMRLNQHKGGRSINLALSHRGIRALSALGLADDILRHAVPMRGRMMHSVAGDLAHFAYSQREDEYINSISRAGLNELLLTKAEAQPNVSIHFGEHCTSVDVVNGKAWTRSAARPDEDLQLWQADVILGTDGANSALREAFAQTMPEFESRTEWESHGYKELTILPDENGAFRMEKNALHIWARQTYMMIALPNYDGTFTCTLFLPMEGENSFADLDTADKINAFFATQFADTLPMIPDLVEQWQRNPVGRLGTLRCNPYIYKDKAALLGDAAHAVVPFYGQGMNASFEDCLAIDTLLRQFGGDWAQTLAAYQAERKPNSDAIGTLAQENFIEMRDHAANPTFQQKRKLELAIEQAYPDYHSKYALVTFHPEVPYTEAHRLGNAQDALLMDLCRKSSSQMTSPQDLQLVYEQLCRLKA